VNDVLQAEPSRAWQTLSRLAVNATLGLGGLFDPATHLHMPNHGEDFGQTLAVWGLGEGPYLVLPLLGPDPPRDAFGQIADIGLDPTSYIHIHNHVMWVGVREYLTLLDLRGQTYETVQGIQRGSVDYYAAMRSFYRQYRDNQIRNGRPDMHDVPNL
jgi:phospholipid-binding lipoprotein MlaA